MRDNMMLDDEWMMRDDECMMRDDVMLDDEK
jgi:hypothetical protein